MSESEQQAGHWEKTRQERVKALLDELKNPEGRSKPRILAEFGVKYGLTPKKVREYVDELVAAGLVGADES